MKKLKIGDTLHRIIDGFEVNESSREVKYSNVKIDFTGKSIADLPLKYQECQLVEEVDIEATDGQRIEGTSFQVNSKKDTLSEIEYVKGQTTQSGTPTPSSPQPINVVSGRQEIDVRKNNNIFVSTPSSAGECLLATGEITTGTSNLRYTTNYIEIPNNVNKLYISGIISEALMNAPAICFYDENQTYISGESYSNRNNFYFNIPSNAKYFRTSYRNVYTNFSITPTNSYEINLGKNLFNKNNVLDTDKNHRLNASGGYYTEQGYFISNMIKIQPSTTYTISYTPTAMTRICYYSTNTTSAFISKNDNQKTFTTPSDAQYLMFCNQMTLMDNIQLEKGNEATTYAQYKTPIFLGNIGNYKDYIFRNTTENPLYDSNLEEGQWYIHKEIGRVVLNGSESWSKQYDNGFRTDITGIKQTTNANQQSYVLSNYYQVGTQNEVFTRDYGICNRASQSQIIIKNKDIATATDLQTWLSTHNTEVYYVLSTPTNTLIEDEELINQLNSIQLLEGINNVVVSSPYLSGIINLHYNFTNAIYYIDTIYTGYVNNYTLPKMKNKLEYRELDIDLLSPLALATLRTTDAVGTYNLRNLIKEIVQPLIDDGFTLKELNVGNNQISVNYLTETIESSLNKLSNKFNFWWYIDKNKNIFINDISYIFNKNKVLTYDDNNKINGLIDFTPSMESIDYYNTIDFTNVRLFTYSSYQLKIETDYISGQEQIVYYSYNSLFKKQTLVPGDEITFDIPFVINTSKSGLTDTTYEQDNHCFRLIKKVDYAYPTVVELLQDNNNQVIIPSNATISDNFNEDKEFVFVRDNFFKNLIVGMKYNGTSTIQVSDITSTTALMNTKIRISDNEEIEKNKDIISTTGIIERQVDANEQWLTYNEILEISKSFIGNNSVNVEKVELSMDIENDLKIGDIISIDKPGFLTNGDFIITDKKRRYYDNVDRWDYTLNNTNILESYVDLFRASDEQEQDEKQYSLITGNYANESIKEKYEVVVQ